MLLSFHLKEILATEWQPDVVSMSIVHLDEQKNKIIKSSLIPKSFLSLQGTMGIKNLQNVHAVRHIMNAVVKYSEYKWASKEYSNFK